MGRLKYPVKRAAANGIWKHYEDGRTAIEFECNEPLADGGLCQNTISPEHQTYELPDEQAVACRACGARHVVVLVQRSSKSVGHRERLVYDHLGRRCKAAT